MVTPPKPDAVSGDSTGQHPVPAVPDVTIPAFFGVGRKAGIIEGLEAFTPAQLGIEPPRIQLIHKKERRTDIGEPGQLKIGGACFDSLDIVVLKAFQGREYFEGEGRETRTLCASSNGRRPHETVLEPKNLTCGDCEYGQWLDNPDGSRKAPPCQPHYALLAIVPGLQDRPVWFIGRKTAFKPTKELTQVATRVAQERGYTAFHQLLVRITTEEQRNGGITWYTPIFTVLQDEVPWSKYRPHYEMIRDSKVEYLPRLAVSTDDVEQQEESFREESATRVSTDVDDEVRESFKGPKTPTKDTDADIPF